MNCDLLISNIEILSKNAGISKTKALTDSGVGKDFIANINKGTSPSIEKIDKLATYFNVSVDYLLGIEQKEKPIAGTGNELDDEILRLFKLLSPESRKIAIAQAEFLVARDKANAEK